MTVARRFTVVLTVVASLAAGGTAAQDAAQDIPQWLVEAREPGAFVFDKDTHPFSFDTMAGWSPDRARIACWGGAERTLEDVACLLAGPTVDAAFTRGIAEFRKHGFDSGSTVGPVEQRPSAASAQGPSGDVLLLHDSPYPDPAPAALMFCNGDTVEQLRQTSIIAEPVAFARKPAHWRLMVAGHELTHTMQKDREVPDELDEARDYCRIRAEAGTRLSEGRRDLEYVAYDSGWVEEGMANYLGYTIMRDAYAAQRRFPFGQRGWKSFYGLKAYQRGFFGPAWTDVVPGYRNSSFWRHLEMAYGFAPKQVFDGVHPYPEDEDPLTLRADTAGALHDLTKRMLGRGGAETLATFFTDFASWVEDRSIVHPTITRWDWWDAAFGGCKVVRLAPLEQPVTVSAEDMMPYGAQCLEVSIAPQPDARNRSYTLKVKAAHADRGVVDGLHIGRAAVYDGSNETGPPGAATWSCGKTLAKKRGVNGDADCLPPRDGIYPGARDGPFRGKQTVRWQLPVTPHAEKGNTETLVLTYAPTKDAGGNDPRRITDDFRKTQEEKPPSITLRVGVTFTNGMVPDRDDAAPEGKERSDGQSPASAAGPAAPAEENRVVELLRVSPMTSQGNPHTVTSLLFADDPRAEIASRLNFRIWQAALAELEGLTYASDMSYRGYRRLMREVLHAEYGLLGLHGETDDAVIDRVRADEGFVKGFATDVVVAEVSGAGVTGPETVKTRLEWILETPQDEPFLTWDDLQPGIAIAATINPERLTDEVNWTPGSLIYFGRGTVRVVDRTRTTLSLAFDGGICPARSAREMPGPDGMPRLECVSPEPVSVEADIAFADTFERAHRRDRVITPTQAAYDRKLLADPRLGLAAPAVYGPDAGGQPQDRPRDDGAAGASGGGAMARAEETCGCDRLSALAGAVAGGMPAPDQMTVIDRCCGAWLGCPGGAPDVDHVLSICRM